MGRQVRYAEEPTAVLQRSGTARQGQLDAMVSRLWRHYARHGHRAAVYEATGAPASHAVTLSESEIAHWLPDSPTLRYRATERVDGAGGWVWVPADATRDLVEELVWTACDCESRGRMWHRWIVDQLCAAIDRDILPPRSMSSIESIAGRLLARMSRAGLVDHASGVLPLLGLPATRWGDSDYAAAQRGRAIALR